MSLIMYPPQMLWKWLGVVSVNIGYIGLMKKDVLAIYTTPHNER